VDFDRDRKKGQAVRAITNEEIRESIWCSDT
jgi:hypothetical protein